MKRRYKIGGLALLFALLAFAWHQESGAAGPSGGSKASGGQASGGLGAGSPGAAGGFDISVVVGGDGQAQGGGPEEGAPPRPEAEAFGMTVDGAGLAPGEDCDGFGALIGQSMDIAQLNVPGDYAAGGGSGGGAGGAGGGGGAATDEGGADEPRDLKGGSEGDPIVIAGEPGLPGLNGPVGGGETNPLDDLKDLIFQEAAGDGPQRLFAPPAENTSVAAVPEPATWIAMLMGFFGLGGVLRRRQPSAVRDSPLLG